MDLSCREPGLSPWLELDYDIKKRILPSQRSPSPVNLKPGKKASKKKTAIPKTMTYRLEYLTLYGVCGLASRERLVWDHLARQPALPLQTTDDDPYGLQFSPMSVSDISDALMKEDTERPRMLWDFGTQTMMRATLANPTAVLDETLTEPSPPSVDWFQDIVK